MWLTDLSSHFVSSRQTSITVSYRFYAVVSQGVSLGRDISISSYGLSYLFTFSGVWRGLGQREVRQLENDSYCHEQPDHTTAPPSEFSPGPLPRKRRAAGKAIGT